MSALGTQDVIDMLTNSANDLVGSAPQEFESRYKADIAMYTKIIREAQIPLSN
jgi:hypothetical protein